MSFLQDFSAQSDKGNIPLRLSLLREQIKNHKLDGYLLAHSNEHRLEILPKSDERLAWLSAFTGSAGMAIIAKKKAALFVDGRYILQAPKETDLSYFEVKLTPLETIEKWIRKNFSKGAIIGFDGWHHSYEEIEKLNKELKNFVTLKPSDNLIDKIWLDRPSPPFGEIKFLPKKLTGKTAQEKIKEIQNILCEKKIDNLILTIPENICWLFNMRGRDVPNTPIVLSFAIIPNNNMPTLYFSEKNIAQDSLMALDKLAHLAIRDEFLKDIKKLAKKRGKIWLDKSIIPFIIADILQKSKQKIFFAPDPILVRKAQKNRYEIREIKKAHILDGVALAKFLHWFDENAHSGQIDEISMVKKLEIFRREEPSLVDISFATIAGAGKNGAIIHYRVDENSNKPLKKGELMLLDSGGQYLSGTTDVTRTLFCNFATKEQKREFTLVLKGMIALSRAIFPIGTTGVQLDSLARQFLWQKGKNYNHGTGHGVGAFLSVHEGPFSISPRSNLAIIENLLLSNEPGFYKEEEYGIRIENLIYSKRSRKYSNYLEFETITLVPIETRLIAKELLTRDEIDWLNDYHKKVFLKISPYLSADVKQWLKKATKPI